MTAQALLGVQVHCPLPQGVYSQKRIRIRKALNAVWASNAQQAYVKWQEYSVALTSQTINYSEKEKKVN